MVERGFRMATSSASADEILPSGVRSLRPDDPAEIGGHRLLGRLGSGGMGVVYLGQDPLVGFVAVKAAHEDATGDDEPRRRLAAEAACIRQVPETCTARLLADGTARTPPYIVTEYVEGRSLADVVRKDGPLPPEQLHALAIGVGRALAAIHAAGLVHRDLKPPNVLLTPTGPRVIDFGIAHEVTAVGGPTGPGMVVGSPGWIPPERLDRQPATPASDVFGWGCLVGYAGLGRNPFGEGDHDELTRRIMREPPDLDGLDDSLRSLVEEALAKDPSARPSAADLLALLGVAGQQGRSGTREPAGQHGRPGTREMPAARSRRLRVPLLATLVATSAVALTAVVVTVAGDNDTPRSPPAGVAPTPPPGNQAATHRVTHRRAVRPTGAAVTPHASPTRPGVRTSPPPVKEKGKGKGKGRGKGKGGSGPGG